MENKIKSNHGEPKSELLRLLGTRERECGSENQLVGLPSDRNTNLHHPVSHPSAAPRSTGRGSSDPRKAVAYLPLRTCSCIEGVQLYQKEKMESDMRYIVRSLGLQNCRLPASWRQKTLGCRKEDED